VWMWCGCNVECIKHVHAQLRESSQSLRMGNDGDDDDDTVRDVLVSPIQRGVKPDPMIRTPLTSRRAGTLVFTPHCSSPLSPDSKASSGSPIVYTMLVGRSLRA